MARIIRVHSISLSFFDSRSAHRFLTSSLASLSSFRTPDLPATSSCSPLLYGNLGTSSLPPSPSFSVARFFRSSFLERSTCISCSPCSPVARGFFTGSGAGKAPEASSAPSSSSSANPPQEDLQVLSKELGDSANSTAISLNETITSSMAWCRGSFENLFLVLRERFDLPMYTSDTVSQLVYTSIAAVLAWAVMPKVFRMFHKYSEDGSHLILRRSDTKPYEASFWFALEEPAKLFISAVAFTQLSSLIAPTTIASNFLSQIWKGAAVLSIVWFLHRWKTSVLSRLLASEKLGSVDRERLQALEKISTVGLLILGGMGVAETCGVAAHSILTVGGVGGVATAFAAKDLLGNILGGFVIQFMKPFSIGDTIKAGPIEGQVVDVGLTSTQLLDLDKFPVAVPNSFFSSQVIVNKSRATWRSFCVKIPVQLNDFEKIPHITEEVRKMLKSHPKVTLQSGVPLCHASHVAGASLEITILCNLIFKGREDLLYAEQEITLQTLKIIRSAGVTLSPVA